MYNKGLFKNDGGRMLDITKDENGYIRVKETLCDWFDTSVKIVLCDIKNKRYKVNNDPWYPMKDDYFEHVNKYYIPKLENKNG